VISRGLWVVVLGLKRFERQLCSMRKEIDAKRGDHCLQADFLGVIPLSMPDTFRLADDTATEIVCLAKVSPL
jgi:hypothetical protein